MSELNTPRLMAAAKEFNIGKDTLVDFLVSKGFNNDDLKPTAKLTEPMYRVLQSEFQQDKAAKEKAEKVELIKTGGSSEPKKKKDEQDLSIKKKETVVVVPTPVEEPKVEEEKPLVIEKAEVNKLLKQHKMMTGMMKRMSQGGGRNFGGLDGIPPELFNNLK